MSAPVRWLDSADAPAGAAELLGGAAPVAIPPDAHMRLAACAGKIAAAPSAGIAGVLATKLAFATAIGAAGVAAAVAAGARTDPEPPRMDPMRTGVPVPSVAAVAAPPSEKVVSVEELPLEPPKPRSSDRRRPPVDTLAAETRLVGAMHRALADDDAARALELGRAYERDFPRGQLGATASLLSARALAKLGRGADARDRAAELVEREPSSVHAEEAVKILADR